MVEQRHTSGFWPSLTAPLQNFGTRLAEWVSPASEATQDDDAYRIAIELPGVQPDDIDLTVEEGVVSLRGEKRFERTEEGENCFFTERQYGSFSRSFRLPADADGESVEAAMKDGVLTIRVPRRAAAGPAARKVRIGAG